MLNQTCGMTGLVSALLSLTANCAAAFDLSNITKTDAATALRTALTQGAGKAVDLLGRSDGFLLNPDVKIPLPPQLQKAERLVRRFGLGAMADEVVTTMNRAA